MTQEGEVKEGLGGEFRMGGKSVACHGRVSSRAGAWEHMTSLGSFSSFSSILWQVALRTFFWVEAVDFSFPRSHVIKPQIKSCINKQRSNICYLKDWELGCLGGSVG